jgi:hypothetical protein
MRDDVRGASLVEYLIVLGLVALAAIGGFALLSRNVNALGEREAECVQTFQCGGGGTASGADAQSADGGTTLGDVVTAVGEFGKGVGLGAVDTVTGLYEMVRHPIDTANGIAFAVENPSLAWEAIKQEWSSRSGAENTGRAFVEVATLFVPGGPLTKIAKVADVARVAGKTAEVAKVGSVAQKVTRVAELAGDAADAKKAACPGGICGLSGKACFGAGTPVMTPGGDTRIETISEGDLVMARDPETGVTEAHRVVRRFVSEEREVLDLGLERDGTIEHLTVTPEHPFWRQNAGWTGAAALDIGDVVATARGEAHVGSMQSLRDRITVYNLEVEDVHTYFVGGLGAWVHNQCSGATAGLKGAELKLGPETGGTRAAQAPAAAAKVEGALPNVSGVTLSKGEAESIRAVNAAQQRVADAINDSVRVVEKDASLDNIQAYVKTLNEGGSLPPVEMAPPPKGYIHPIIVSGYDRYIAGQLAGKPVDIKVVAAPTKFHPPTAVTVE